MKGKIRQLPFILIILVVSLFIMEGLSRALISIDAIEQRIFNGDSYFSKVRYVYSRSSLPSADVNLYFDQFDSTKGWSLIPNTLYEDYYKHYRLTIDSLGNRVHPVDNRLRPSLRIVTIGDSYTFGEEVDDTSTYAALLEKNLPGTAVTNFGVPGYGIDQMLIKYREQLPFIKPDLIILSFISDDIKRCFTDFSFYQKPFFYKQDNEWRLSKVEASPEDFYVRYHFHSKLMMLMKLFIHKLFFPQNFMNGTPEEEKEILEFLLKEFKQTTDSIGANLIVTVIPTTEEIRDTLLIKNFRYINHLSQQLSSEMQIDFINQEPCFNEAMKKGLDISSFHWQEDGNRVIATCITDYLIEKKFAMKQ